MKKEHNKKKREDKKGNNAKALSSPVCFAASDELRLEYQDLKEDDERDGKKEKH